MSKTSNIDIITDTELKEPQYSEITEKAIQETRDIQSGKVKTKTFSSVAELLENF